MPTKTIVYSYELEEELKNNKNIFVMFSASWCGPCKVIKPEFLKFSNDRKYENICFVQIDIDEADQICNEYKINSIPTFIMFVDGVVYERIEGNDVSKIQKILDER